MRHKYLVAVSFILIIFALGSQAQQPEKRLSVVVYNLEAEGISGSVANIMTNAIVSELSVSEKLFVRDEKTTIAVLKEKGMAQTDYCNADVCRIDTAKLIKADRLVLGNIGKMGETLVINIRVADVNGTTIYPQKQRCPKCNEDQLLDIIENMARNIRLFLETGKKTEIAKAPTIPPAHSQPPTTSPRPSPPSTPSSHPPISPSSTTSQAGSPVIPKSIDTTKVASTGIFTSNHEGKTMVIFLRPPSKVDGRNLRHDISDNHKLIGSLSYKSYFYYETDPGIHSFKVNVKIPFGGKIEKDILNLQLNVGKTVFIKSFLGQVGFEFIPLDPIQGLDMLKELKYTKNVIKSK